MNFKPPKVSIGLPVFNGDRFLSEALESLLAQTFRGFEIIICDNASDDGTEEICQRFAKIDRRVRYYRNPYNIGPPANFNRTFELSSGEYFKWAAHDDLHSPEFLNRCVEVLDRDTRAVLAYPKAMIINPESRELEPYDLKLPTDSCLATERFEALLGGHRCYEIFGLIRRDVLMKTPLIGSYAHGDGVLLTRLALFGRFVEIPEYLFFPRRHPNQSMQMLPDYRRYAVWFNPRLRNKKVFPYWRMHWEFFRSINIVPLRWSDRIRCYRLLARTIRARRHQFLKEIAFYLPESVTRIALMAINPFRRQRS